MNTIETLFVPYELAVKLKELGFDEPCLGNYRLPTNRLITEWEIKNTPENCLGVSAPTFSQAFRFFREKYGFYVIINPSINNDFTCVIWTSKRQYHIGVFPSPEEAELACLVKLISIVEQ